MFYIYILSYVVVVGGLVAWACRACQPAPFDHDRFRCDQHAREAESNGRKGA